VKQPLDTLVIVGVGLLGGSLARAALTRGLARNIIGVDPDTERRRRLREERVVTGVEPTVDPAARVADMVVVCTPVDHIAEQVLAAARVCRTGTLITDAGSTKAAIVHAVEGNLPPEVSFVGSHPLAGSEKQGPEHASADLFQNRLVLVTPTEHTKPNAIEETERFWQALGARTRRLSPEDHDAAVAWTSHLPHLTAAALAGVLPPGLSEFTATGFRDTTRLASGSPELWLAIFEQNRDALQTALGGLQDRLAAFAAALAAEDWPAVLELLREGKAARDGK
jgi:prephenate dehydrogenase